MEIKLRLHGGTVISSDSKTRKEAKKTSADARSEISDEIRRTAREVRELIQKSNELEVLAKRMDEVGYSEWVKSGDRDEFFRIMKTLNSGAASAREYWEDRYNPRSSHRKARAQTAAKSNNRSDDSFEP